jgi:hypothetical protein
VDVDRDVRALEVLQASRVVEVQVAHDDGFDVFDGVPCLGDLRGEFVVGLVVDSGEDVV